MHKDISLAVMPCKKTTSKRKIRSPKHEDISQVDNLVKTSTDKKIHRFPHENKPGRYTAPKAPTDRKISRSPRGSIDLVDISKRVKIYKQETSADSRATFRFGR